MEPFSYRDLASELMSFMNCCKVSDDYSMIAIEKQLSETAEVNADETWLNQDLAHTVQKSECVYTK